MRADLAERLINHPGQLGGGREEILRRFLRDYLPKRFEVSSGFVFDSGGKISRQLDVIVADAGICPRFEIQGGSRVYPCESVVAVGQVKSSLTSKAEFLAAMENLASAKRLDRAAFGRPAVDGGGSLEPSRSHLDEVFTFLFISGRAMARVTMHELLVDYVSSTPITSWPNVVLALDRYLATFCCDNGVCSNPYDARGIAMQPKRPNDELLVRFYLLLGSAISAIRVSDLPYWDYLQDARSWTADVYSSTENPPPYLQTLTIG